MQVFGYLLGPAVQGAAAKYQEIALPPQVSSASTMRALHLLGHATGLQLDMTASQGMPLLKTVVGRSSRLEPWRASTPSSPVEGTTSTYQQIFPRPGEAILPHSPSDDRLMIEKGGQGREAGERECVRVRVLWLWLSFSC